MEASFKNIEYYDIFPIEIMWELIHHLDKSTDSTLAFNVSWQEEESFYSGSLKIVTDALNMDDLSFKFPKNAESLCCKCKEQSM